MPSLLPENNSDRIEGYFRLLAEAITSTLNKLNYEIPEWVNGFKFEKEIQLEKKRDQLLNEANEVDLNISLFQDFKRILLFDGNLLVEAVIETLKKGFGLKIDDQDEYREDFKILDSNGKVMVFGEIKGTNSGVKREHINQVDSHRERASISHEFPAILIINTHIKNSRTVDEKDQPVPSEQIRHAANNNILIVRTLDLLCYLRIFLSEQKRKDEMVDILRNNSGWMVASNTGWEIRTS